MNRILFRVDASQKIGFGHLTRCLSIALSLTDHQIIIISTEPLSRFLDQYLNDFFVFRQISSTDEFFQILNKKDLVIIDGYQFDSKYHSRIKANGSTLICIDDLADQKMYADVVINPTPAIEASDYVSEIDTQFFIGLNYALLRPSFLKIAQKTEFQKEKNSLLICFGGSDPLNITKKALLTAINSKLFNEIHVVLGPGYVFLSGLNEIKDYNVQFHHSLPEIEMANLLSKIEYAIVPCSGILLECLAAKMKIISGFYVENQKRVYENHLKINSFTDAKNFSEADLSEAINKVKKANISKISVDGRSLDRIVKIIEQLLEKDDFLIRTANESDTELTFEWANDPETRKYSFNKELIKWEDHQNWFSNKINSSNCLYLILERKGIPTGSMRFDIKDMVATISYLVAPEMHGQGIGTMLMKLGLKKLSENFTSQEIKEVQGYVISLNVASIITFERFGFLKEITKDSLLFKKKFSSND